MEGIQMRLYRQMQRHLTQARSRMDTIALRLRYVSPENQLNTKRQYALDLEDRLTIHMQRALREAKHRLQLLAQQMEVNSPLKKLGEGYSLVTDESGETVRDFAQIETGMQLNLRMLEGDVITRVEGKQCRKDRIPGL